MLWSLIKIVVFVALVAALTLGFGFLIENDGTGLAQAQITLMGMEYTLSPVMLVLLLIVTVIGLYVLFKVAGFLVAVLKWINGDETAFSRYFDRNRERRGYQALSEGLMALASGEGQLAMAKAKKAGRYLDRPELTDLLTAQGAEMAGDARKAEEVYKKLLGNEQTRFVGVRGLMKQKLAGGDTDTALKLAERAFAIKPKHGEVGDTLLRLQAESKDFVGARKTLATKLKNGALPRDVHKRRDAVLALSTALEIKDGDERAKAVEAAIAANKASPDLVPAAAMAAQGFIEQGRKRNARNVIKKAWEVHPHPDLAAAFAAIEPEETAEARLKRFEFLLRIKPEDRENKLLRAELNLAAEDFPAARRALGDLVETDADARVLAIMAAVERGEGSSDTVVRGWLAKAVTAPRGPQWVCDNCNTIHAEWAPLCSNCSAFDTLTWTNPPQSEVVLPASANMLPLIVGALEDKSAEVVVPVDEADVSADEVVETVDAEVIEDAETLEDEPKEDAAK
ncbi:heme biosynthesis protein HemY [Tropicibacter sp. R15_0]|uniref:heme biosynthesis protein HemY n=1 Tax=Tropicibacter sp. R15_0 TaxID=2821101 RepID=UPI001AD9BE16|nr:heme biosynthesis HemY N-terminal domain-containing protein [Tropicibacter sp. R15_0]MBO9463752.1 heme biosynthesis protein HemY [Tropicibacter sp. R15_0]